MHAFIALAIALASFFIIPVDAVDGQLHPEIIVGRDASGRLVAKPSSDEPFSLPPSRFTGIEGFADALPGFNSLFPEQQTDDFRPIDDAADVAFEVVEADPGMTVLNDRGTRPLEKGEPFRLGRRPFDFHPVWIAKAGDRKTYAFRLRLRDRAGVHGDSEVFRVTFAPDPGVEVYMCPMKCEGQKIYERAGGCPVCGMHLKLVSTRRYRVDVTPLSGALEPDETETLRFTIRDPAGTPVDGLEIVHEKLMHLLMTSEDLSWFAHEHPELRPDGSFELRTKFPAPGRYTLFHDFTPRQVGMQVVPVEISVPGKTPAPVALKPDAERAKIIDGYTVRLTSTTALTALRNATITVSLARDGAPVTDLEPYLGAAGHMIIVSLDRAHFVHSHPLEAPGATPVRGPDVTFQCQFPAPGLYKSWSQFQHHGRVLTIPFTFQVLPAGATADVAAAGS